MKRRQLHSSPLQRRSANMERCAAMGSGKIPMNVCVAGHRDIVPTQTRAIEDEVRRFFQDLQQRYPATPLRCYSALAIGADQLVARIALELRLELIAVLPAPKQVYLEHFFEGNARGDFDRLYAGASRTVTISLPDGFTTVDLEDHAWRSRQFASLGNYLADRSLVLLALYDGVDVERIGGTAWIAERKKQGRQQTGVTRFDFPETGLVYHIAIRRLSEPGVDAPISAGYESHEGEHPSDYMYAFSQIAAFNERAASFTEVAKSSLAFTTEAADAFAAADNLAVAEKRTLQRARIWLFVCAVAMFCTYVAYSNLEFAKLLLTCYVAAQIVGALLWLRLQRSETFNRYLSYRSLAEALRVQLSWQSSGLPNQVVDHFQRKHRVKSRWIRLALRALSEDKLLVEDALWSNRKILVGNDAGDLALVKEQWIDPALQHFRDTALSRGRNAAAAKNLAKVLYCVGVCSGFASLISSIYPASISPALEHTLVICMGAMPGLAALILNFSDNQGWEEDAIYSEHMAGVFSRCVALWDSVPRIDLISEVGKEALRHNGDWLSLHTSRQLKSPSL